MAKLRPLSKPEDIAAVPADRPVAIDLSTDTSAVEVSEVEKVDTKAAPPAPAPEPEPEPEEESPLRKQLQEMDREHRRQLAERDARHAAEIAERERKAEQSDFDLISIGLTNAQAEVDRAQNDYEVAVASGDIKAQAEANRRQQAGLVKVDRYEEAKSTIEGRREQQKAQPAQSTQSRLPKVAEDWLASHPEYKTDQRKIERIGKVHDLIVNDEGIMAFSPEYFESLEDHLRIRKVPEREPEVEVIPPRRSHPVSAPVSRDSPSMSTGRPQRRTVELSPEQREAARISGVDELTYAKGVLELQRRKKLGMYPDHD